MVRDSFAGAVVFLVALPLCLGIALASGAPLISGLIAGVVGGVLVGVLSGSHTSVSGPAAGLTAVIAAQIAALGSFEAFLVALIIAGVLQIIMGLARVGFIADFFPSSVVKGLLAAIGIILILKQLPHLAGWDTSAIGELAFWQIDNENTFSEFGKVILDFHSGAMLIGLLSLVVLIAWDQVGSLKNSRLPAPLVVVAFGVTASLVISMFGGPWTISPEHLVQVPVINEGSSLLGLFRWPDFSQFANPSIYLAGITIALVASLETLLNLEAIDKIDPQKRVSPPNRELVAQGIGNTLLGFIGGLPVTSVVIRGSVNINAGARTKFSAIFHGLLLAFFFLSFPQLLNQIPLSCLAAILIVTGLKLASPKIVKQMWRQGLNQFVPFFVTVVAIVLTDLLVGVLIGLATSIVFILHSNLRRPLLTIEEHHLGGDVLHVVLSNQVSFLNRAAFQRIFAKVPSGGHILLDARHTDYIDADILGLITDFRDESALARGIKVSLVGFKKAHNLENRIHYAEHSTNEVQKELTPKKVLQILKEGNERVRQGRRLQRDFDRQITATSAGQFPFGVVLSCIDSRASVELIFDLGIGDMFSTRIAGNVISQKVLGSLEFACAIAGAKLILVMGHTRCGAVSAAVEFSKSSVSVRDATGCQHLDTVVNDIQGVVSRHGKNEIPEKNSVEREVFEDHIAHQNVIECMRRILEQSSTLNQLSEQDKIAIVGCIYDVRSGDVKFVQ